MSGTEAIQTTLNETTQFGPPSIPEPHRSGLGLVQPRTAHRRWYWQQYEKAEYECPDCGRGAPEVGEFHVHHKDGDYRNGRPENLIGLCNRCHYIWSQRGSV